MEDIKFLDKRIPVLPERGTYGSHRWGSKAGDRGFRYEDIYCKRCLLMRDSCKCHHKNIMVFACNRCGCFIAKVITGNPNGSYVNRSVSTRELCDFCSRLDDLCG